MSNFIVQPLNGGDSHCLVWRLSQEWVSFFIEGKRKYLENYNFCGDFSHTPAFPSLNPLTPKIWLFLLPSSCCTFPCKLFMRIWCSIRVIFCTWWVWVFSLPVCCIMYGYYREKLRVNHFWELKG